MDKGAVRQFLAYVQEFHAQLLNDLEGYESKGFLTARIDGDGNRIDTTQQTIADLKRRSADVERIIAAYKAELDA